MLGTVLCISNDYNCINMSVEYRMYCAITHERSRRKVRIHRGFLSVDCNQPTADEVYPIGSFVGRMCLPLSLEAKHASSACLPWSLPTYP